MKSLKEFEEFVKEGIVKKITPDFSRAEFLKSESEKSYLFLQKLIKFFNINNQNANSIIKLCYDIIMESIRIKMLEKGYKSSGNSSHEAEVSYLRKMEFSENEVLFVNELRYLRNSIVYYGKILDKDYAEKVVNFLNKIKKNLRS